MKPLYSKKANRTRRSKGNNSFTNLAFESLEDRRMLAAVTVNTAVDLVDGDTTTIASLIAAPGVDGTVSIREALLAANNSPEADTITFDSSVFNGEADDVIHLQEELPISQSVTIDGDGLGVVISGDALGDDALLSGSFITDVDSNLNSVDNVRVFNSLTTLANEVTLRGLTITGGNSGSVGGGGINSSAGSLNIIDSNISGNVAGGDGGGVNRGGEGTVSIVNSVISDNFSSTRGGGFSVFLSDTVLDRSTVSGNEASAARGGGIIVGFGDLAVSSSTISGNVLTENRVFTIGGGIRAFDSVVTITDTTIADNSSTDGGGISINSASAANQSLLTLENSIVAGNDSDGDILIGNFSADFEVSSSLIGDNTGISLAAAPIGSPDADGNFVGDALNPIDPLLGDLADNGGSTQTHALLVGSPAIDTGSTTSTTDQRGELRPNQSGNGPDIGAFEEQTLSLIVDTSNDLIDGDFSVGNLSLREAIAQANANEGVDRIAFDAQVFDGGAEDVIRLINGQLEVTEGVEIDTHGLQVIVSGDALGNDLFDPETFFVDIAASDSIGSLSDNSRVFNIATAAGDSVRLSGLTITGGNAIEGGGGIAISSAVVGLDGVNISGNRSSDRGGGILSDSQLIFDDSIVSGNIAGGSGGGIFVDAADVTLHQSVVSDNRATLSGGGIDFVVGQLTIDQSTISGNVVQSPTAQMNATGGGIASAGGDIVITSSTISGNSVNGKNGQGGGVYSMAGSLSISSSTVSGNSATTNSGASTGGGILIGSQSTFISDSTITENAADIGGGISIGSPFAAVTLDLSNSIVANNTAISSSADIAAGLSVTINSSSSLIGDNSGTSLMANSGVADADGNLIGTTAAPIDPLLEILVDNGGLTETHALATGSPALDTGNSSLNFDQRGLGRLRESGVDIGAFEVQGPLIIVDTSDGFADGDFSAGNLSLTEAIALSNSTPEIETIAFDPAVFNGDEADVIRLQQELLVSQSVTIDASGLDVVVSGDTLGNDDLVPGTFISDFGFELATSPENIRPFNINTNFGDTVTLRGLTITGGFDESQDGGGIGVSSASLVIEDSVVSGNFTRANGGGIAVANGSLIVENSVIAANATVRSRGGGVYSTLSDVTISSSTLSEHLFDVGIFSNGGVVTISNSSINENAGTGISTIDADVILDRSTVSNNARGILISSGSLTVSNSTISGNSTNGGSSGFADAGGIRAFAADVSIYSSTITDNRSNDTGGISINSSSSDAEPALLTVNNSIIADNFGSFGARDIDNREGDFGEFAAAEVDISSSLIGDNRGSTLNPAPAGSPDASGNIVGSFSNIIDPLLEDLADNGGPTQTHALRAGSPAFDNGETTLTIDQRGELRPDAGGNGPDIGAYEQQLFTFVVDTNDDLNDGDFSTGNQSLREAIERANANSGVDTILFDARIFDGGADNVIRLQDTLSISDGVVIDAGGLGIVVSGDVAGNDVLVAGSNVTDTFASGTSDTLDDNVNVISIIADAGETVTITGLTVTGGSNAISGGGINNVDGDLELIRSVVSGNRTRFGRGGGISSNDGHVTLIDSTVASNTTGETIGSGGGISTDGGDVTLIDSTIANNTTTSENGDGGGIITNSGDLTFRRSTISFNQTNSSGGAAFTSAGNILIINSTISGNQAFLGGGILVAGSDSIQITNSTITNNQSVASGGGIRIFTNFSDTLTIENSIIAGNITTAGVGVDLSLDSNLSSVVRSSLIGSNAGNFLQATSQNTPDSDGNFIGFDGGLIDPLLGRLADNGGPTLTHGLLPGSPALNAGGTASIDVGTIDQRGADRILDGQIDIGAFEGEVSQIADVILSSSGFSNNFIDAIDGEGIGSGNGLGFSLVGDQQLSSVPWQNIDTIHLQFLTDVSASLDDGDILLTGTNGGDYSLGPISFDTTSFVATVPIIGGIENDSLVISIFDGAVFDSGGESIVGDNGEQFNFFFNVLPGDQDGSGQVNSQDALNVFASNTDLTIPENARRDINGSGQINSTDALVAFANNTNGLPAMPLAPIPIAVPITSHPPAAETDFDTLKATIDAVFSEEKLLLDDTVSGNAFPKTPINTIQRLIKTPTIDVATSLETPASFKASNLNDTRDLAAFASEPTQSKSLPKRLIRSRLSSPPVFAIARNADDHLSQRDRWNTSPELKLAGHVEIGGAEESERDIFYGIYQAADKVDSDPVENVFQVDLAFTDFE